MFIEVHERDVECWIAFFQQFGVGMTINECPDAGDIDGNVHYVLFPKTDGIDIEWVDGKRVR